MDLGLAIGVSSLMISIALGIAGWRGAMVRDLMAKVEALEKENERYMQQLEILRGDNDWLIREARRRAHDVLLHERRPRSNDENAQ
jgi:hypothetical protein